MSDRPADRFRDHVHDASRLENRRLELVDVADHDLPPELRAQHVLHLDRLRAHEFAIEPAARILVVAAALARALTGHVAELAVERAPASQRFEEDLLVLP